MQLRSHAQRLLTLLVKLKYKLLWMGREEPVGKEHSLISCKSTQFHTVKGNVICFLLTIRPLLSLALNFWHRIIMYTQSNNCGFLLTYRSLFGGQTLDINGRGFGQDAVEVILGDHHCNIVSQTDTEIVCVTTSSANDHYINNDA